MSEYALILTNTGLSKIAEAMANGTEINITQIAFGDANGEYYEPNPQQTSLMHEVTRININNKSIDEMNLKELTNNFDCDTIEKVVKSYEGFIMQTEVLDVIQREYKKEKVKNLWNMDITDVNKFCDLLREELKSHKYQINENNINEFSAIYSTIIIYKIA